MAGRRERQPVRSVHPRVPAEHVARELVEYDDQGQTASRLLLPELEPARCGLLIDALEAIPDLTVEIRISCEPDLPELPIAFLALTSEPERENLLRVRSHPAPLNVSRSALDLLLGPNSLFT